MGVTQGGVLMRVGMRFTLQNAQMMIVLVILVVDVFMLVPIALVLVPLFFRRKGELDNYEEG